MKLKLLIGLVLLGSLGTAHAESAAELQSRCGNDAAAFFTKYKHDQADPANCIFAGGCNASDYENNYSESMKGCFIVIKEETSWRQTYSYHETKYRLFEINAHRDLGIFSEVKTDDPAYNKPNPDGFFRPMVCLLQW